MPIKFRRGLNADRTSITPESGEPIWTTDTKNFYVGDGSTAGGILIAGSGDVTGPSSSTNNHVVFFNGTTGKVIKDSGLTLSGTNTGDQTITLTGDVTGSGTGSFATTISAGAVTLAKMAALPSLRIIGNNTGSSTTPLALTGSQVTAMLDNFTSSLKGLTPASGGGTINFLRADGTWAAITNQTISFTPSGDISSTGGSGSTSLTPVVTVTGIKGVSIPTLSTGLLKYNGTGWVFDNSTYLTTAVTSISFGTTGLTPSTSSTGAVTVSGTLNVSNGGTGATTLTGVAIGNGTSAMTAVSGTAVSGLDLLCYNGTSYQFNRYDSLPPFEAGSNGFVPAPSLTFTPPTTDYILTAAGTWLSRKFFNGGNRV